MDLSALSLITVVLFLPMVGLIVLLFMREEQAENIKWTAFGFSIATFIASLLLWIGFDNSAPGLQMVQRLDFLPTYGISYYVGVDGLSLLLVILTTLPARFRPDGRRSVGFVSLVERAYYRAACEDFRSR